MLRRVAERHADLGDGVPGEVTAEPFDTLRAQLLTALGAAIERAMAEESAAALGPEQRSWCALDCLLSLAASGVVHLACARDQLPPPTDPRLAVGVRASLIGLAGTFLHRLDPQLLRLAGILEPSREGHA